jgi:hypothetical protein
MLISQLISVASGADRHHLSCLKATDQVVISLQNDNKITLASGALRLCIDFKLPSVASASHQGPADY